jgi:large subunit ribosomal protein L15
MKLPKIITKKGKRIGRGYGSGKGGHTVGRGQKGQKARRTIGVLFEGVKVKKSLIKRLPLKRGKGKFNSRPKPLVVNLEALNILPAGTQVTMEVLISKGIVDRKSAEFGIKILGGGTLSKKLTVSLPISESAAKKVESAGGKVINKE